MTVSVIIPCYNVEKYLEASISSVWNQSYKDLEIICVDDGSQDQTTNLLEKLQKNSPIKMQLVKQKNQGASAARNKGLSLAKGDYFQFLDADDVLLPEKIQHQMDLALENGIPELIVGSYRRQNGAGQTLFERVYKNSDQSEVWLMLMKTNLGITSANLFNSEFFRNGGRWDESMKSSQEYKLMFQILQQYDRVIFDSVVHTIIQARDSGSISQMNAKGNWIRYVQMRVDILEFLKHNKKNLDYRRAYQILFDAIRALYPYDPPTAIQFYKNHIPGEFSPEVSDFTSARYIKLYKMLGFELAESLKDTASKFKKMLTA